MPEQALSGLKVIEFGDLVAAPYCGKLMADLGAEVIKIETPGVGDEARRRKPFAGEKEGVERSGLFAYLNTNKFGITLDPETEKGNAIFKSLIKDADILIESNSPKRMQSLGLDYASLEKINPRLIVTSITPFGQTGPHRDYKATELNLYHGGGFGMSTTAVAEEPVPTPVKAGGRQALFGAGLSAAVASLCGIFARENTGEGQQVDISAQECLAGQYESAIEQWTFDENEMGGVSVPMIMPIMPLVPLPCKDGHVFLMCVEEREYDNLVKVMGNPEWTNAPEFADGPARWDHEEELDEHIEAWTRNSTYYEITEILQSAGVAAFPVLSNRGLVEDPHLNNRGFFEEWDHPEIGKRKYDGVLWKMSKTPGKIRRHAPLVGQDNNHVFGELLGMSQGEIDRLVDEKVIY